MQTHDDRLGDPPGVHDQIAAQLAAHGWHVQENCLDAALLTQLADEAQHGWQAGEFRRAGVGQGKDRQLRPEIRTDHVNWVDPETCSPAMAAYLDWIEQLRLAINRALYLGLIDFEGHLAVYPPGSFYQTHLDRFSKSNRRTVSTALYLNPDWQATDGGQLRIYTDPAEPALHLDVVPQMGTLAIFMSDRFPHQVLPAQRERMSMSGWFRTRS